LQYSLSLKFEAFIELRKHFKYPKLFWQAVLVLNFKTISFGACFTPKNGSCFPSAKSIIDPPSQQPVMTEQIPSIKTRDDTLKNFKSPN
jgi:hypothetical protein